MPVKRRVQCPECRNEVHIRETSFAPHRGRDGVCPNSDRLLGEVFGPAKAKRILEDQ